VKSYRKMGAADRRSGRGRQFRRDEASEHRGLVSVHTVAEQILYEIGPPAYVTPEVLSPDSIQSTSRRKGPIACA
jgi:hypothetical protein